MDDRDVAAAPPSVQPSDDPTQTNVDARSASREHVTAAMSGPAPGFGSGPSVEEPQKPQEPQEPREPPPSAQLPTAARARAQASNSATRSSTTAPVPGRAPAPVPGHEQPALRVPHFVAPSSYLRFKASHGSAMAAAAPEPISNPSPPSPPSPLDKDQRQGLKAIRDFLKVRTSYDVLPLSFRLIVMDTNLLIKKTLNILIQNSIVSAPVWDSQRGRFAGILTATDYINVIQYYCQFPDEMSKLDQFRLSSLRDIERAIGATPIETVSVHPSRPLYEACRRMLKTRARRIPLVDVDDETGKETVISVITQYRILKFIAVNNEHNTVMLKKTVRDIGLGTYSNLATLHMDDTVLDAVHLMVDRNISCVPIVDSKNRVLNAFEAVDVIPCLRGGAYEELDDSIGEALCKRPEDSPGIYTCGEGDRLDSLFDTIRKSRVHRLIVIDDDNNLRGVISLSDILKYVLVHGEEDSPQQ
ncbi:AMP-activated serine/threonine-protein kinase regulatory subunit [Metarhizium rileyi]|uniref:AMP-activated serine/threonine-protein kinase regulatory subunit n=1 Tax=Metarhizium rileyi (strain RCEF 4871) TaxID=1649241 RepID=A0A5C6GG36_METRR|nr:AMP-activated serine/threonine-protein kinase regulatory subunit [Metarhizium rileyi]